MNWKLLGVLLPSELRLKCERAGIAASDKDSHNCVRLSKYVMSNGYDPETFFFNTIYQTDKTSPLIGMTPGAAGRSSSQAKVASSTPLPTTSNPIRMDLTAKNSLLHPSDESMKTLLDLFTTISVDIQKLVTLTELIQIHVLVIMDLRMDLLTLPPGIPLGPILLHLQICPQQTTPPSRITEDMTRNC